MPVDAYVLRRRLEDLRFRMQETLRDRVFVNRLKIGLLGIVCLIPILWLMYRSLPEKASIILNPSQSFLLEANTIIAGDGEEEKYRFAEVGIFEAEDGGAIQITGTVRQQGDLEFLQQRLEALQAPAPLHWDVEVQQR